MIALRTDVEVYHSRFSPLRLVLEIDGTVKRVCKIGVTQDITALEAPTIAAFLQTIFAWACVCREVVRDSDLLSGVRCGQRLSKSWP